MVFGKYILTIYNSKNILKAGAACNEETSEAEGSVHKTSFIH